jgi:hypothetical protein
MGKYLNRKRAPVMLALGRDTIDYTPPIVRACSRSACVQLEEAGSVMVAVPPFGLVTL